MFPVFSESWRLKVCGSPAVNELYRGPGIAGSVGCVETPLLGAGVWGFEHSSWIPGVQLFILSVAAEISFPSCLTYWCYFSQMKLFLKQLLKPYKYMGKPLWAVFSFPFFLSFNPLHLNWVKILPWHQNQESSVSGTLAVAAHSSFNLAFAENSAFLSGNMRLKAYRRMVLLCLLRLVTHDQTNLVKRFICLA